MPVKVIMNQENCQIALDGEMTIFTAEELRVAMLKSLVNAKDIEVDLSQVTEIDTAGLQLMLMAKLATIARGNTLRFIGHSTPVQEILDLTELSGFFGDPVVLQSAA